MLEQALQYAAIGWHVFPCHTPISKTGWSCSCEAYRRTKYPDYVCDNPGKHPRTPHGLDDATTDEAQIREWWARWPNANIGISCGPSKILVLDLDLYKDTYKGKEFELDEDTPTAITGGGGSHVVYAREGELGNRRKGLPEGIDIRGEGGYIIAAPSLHKSGNRYQWEIDYSPFEKALKPVPQKLIELLTPPKGQPKTFITTKNYVNQGSVYGIAALKNEMANIASAANGTRNTTLNTAAYTLAQLAAGGELDPDFAKEQLISVAITAGLSQAEAEQTTESGFSAGTQNPRSSRAVDDEDPFLIGDCPDSHALRYVNAHQRISLYPYAVREGVLKVIKQGDKRSGDDEGDTFVPIADFNAWITQELIHEDGKKSYIVEGTGLRGSSFEAKIDAELFGNSPQLLSVMEAAAGALNKVFAGMAKHVGPAIKTLSENVEIIKFYDHTGWNKEGFLFPGHEQEGQRIELYKQLRYGVTLQADLTLGLEALSAYLSAIPPEQSTVFVTYLLSAPIYRKFTIGDRYGMYVAGLSGSLKTTYCQVGMCLYGDFINDDALLKWGVVGSTVNALSEICARAADLPILVDNYKPNTSNRNDLTQFIHMVMEGGTKARLGRNSQIKDSVSINCWPIITGEDVPADDGAALARLLVLYFKKQTGMNHALAEAQEKAAHLCAVGSLWIRWIEANQATITQGRFNELRGQWTQKLQEIEGVLNPLRIANNLALNQLVFEAALQHPILGPILAPLEKAHLEGIKQLFRTMASNTSESVESVRWLNIIRELVAAGKAKLLDTKGISGDLDRERMIGWKDEQGIYLLPNAVDAKIREFLGPNALNGISQKALYNQLDSAQMIARKSDKTTIVKRFENTPSQRVLWLVPHALDIEEDADESTEVEELGL